LVGKNSNGISILPGASGQDPGNKRGGIPKDDERFDINGHWECGKEGFRKNHDNEG